MKGGVLIYISAMHFQPCFFVLFSIHQNVSGEYSVVMVLENILKVTIS